MNCPILQILLLVLCGKIGFHFLSLLIKSESCQWLSHHVVCSILVI